MKPAVCPACGARLAGGATHCDLCGHDITAPAEDSEAEEVLADPVGTEPAEVASGQPTAAPIVEGGPFCTDCGTQNPTGARFCYRCGHALHGAASEDPVAESGAKRVREVVPVVPAPQRDASGAPPARPASDAGRRAFALLGAGVLAVLLLFFLTRASTDGPTDAPATPTAAVPTAPSAPAPLSEEVEAQAAELEAEIESLSGDERLAKQEELARLYARSAAFAQAAEVQQAVAEVRQTALAWADAGSFYLAAMLRTQGPERATLAQASAAAYEQSLELDPTDLDVKTDLATAYLNDAQNPMLAVQTVKDVLAERPDHVRANFNYGLMLAQINRTEQALEQFEKVISLTDHDDPVHQRAEQERARIEAAVSGTAAG